MVGVSRRRLDRRCWAPAASQLEKVIMMVCRGSQHLSGLIGILQKRSQLSSFLVTRIRRLQIREESMERKNLGRDGILLWYTKRSKSDVLSSQPYRITRCSLYYLVARIFTRVSRHRGGRYFGVS